MVRKFFAAVTAALLATSAQAEFQKVDNQAQFTQLVSGKTLTRPMIKLEVSPQGAISGTGLRWEVSGNWTWQNGFFCRDLFWGGSDLGYNCQEVRVNGDSIRFTSDRGTGRFADFRLR